MYRRVIIVIADGLRPDAVTTGRMPTLSTIGADYTRAVSATTVRPSATVAALTSLATGVRPETHGLIEPGLGFLAGIHTLKPLARELARDGHATAVVASELGFAERQVVWALAKSAGVSEIVAHGRTGRETAEAARERLARLESGLLLVYLPECDAAGHREGWMSDAYLEAAGQVDAAIGEIAGAVARDLLLVLSDHGGGGVDPRDHNALHPLNERIPLVVGGPLVRRRHRIRRPVSLLDVPPTALWALGVDVPAAYEGRVLEDAFLIAEPLPERHR